jgi:uncharacterized protein YlxW (UPF0749 family)
MTRSTMRNPSSQVTIGVVALILGLLLVVQIRAQSAGSRLDALSAQELTQLVGNLNTKNDQLRAEVASTQSELNAIKDGQARGETSLGQSQADLDRIRAWAGLVAVRGPGVQLTVQGGIPGTAVDDLLNELRNAGSEAIQVSDVRVVPGSVVAGATGGLSIQDTALDDPFLISAIGNPETLTGSLTRAGGIIAQLKATFPAVQILVTPVDRLVLPPSTRDLVPVHGAPRL